MYFQPSRTSIPARAGAAIAVMALSIGLFSSAARAVPVALSECNGAGAGHAFSCALDPNPDLEATVPVALDGAGWDAFEIEFAGGGFIDLLPDQFINVSAFFELDGQPVSLGHAGEGWGIGITFAGPGGVVATLPTFTQFPIGSDGEHMWVQAMPPGDPDPITALTVSIGCDLGGAAFCANGYAGSTLSLTRLVVRAANDGFHYGTAQGAQGVPAPAPVWLLGLGLLGFAGRAMRRGSKR